MAVSGPAAMAARKIAPGWTTFVEMEPLSAVKVAMMATPSRVPTVARLLAHGQAPAAMVLCKRYSKLVTMAI